MERKPSELRIEYAELATATHSAVEAAGQYLDDRGHIDYARFDDAAFDALAEGPGGIFEPAQIEPHHIGTTIKEFAQMSNNFHTLFDEFWGKRRRERRFYQRFKILFPDLADALMAQYREYATRCMTQERPSYVIEPEMFEPLRTAYGIMAQLIDENDEFGNDQLVRDCDATQVLRA